MLRDRGMMHLAIAIGLLSAIGGWAATAADKAADQNRFSLLIADIPDSTAVIESNDWATPLWLRVVTLNDVPVLSPVSSDRDPNLPARIATTIRHPLTGELIHINIVEVAVLPAVDSVRNRRTESATWLMNDQMPFTRDAEVEAALRGDSVRQLADAPAAFENEPIGWITGEPIVEIYVRLNTSTLRTARPHYGIQIVGEPVDPIASVGTDAAGDGGDPGGSPDPPECDGGDPGGCPDPPGARRRNGG